MTEPASSDTHAKRDTADVEGHAGELAELLTMLRHYGNVRFLMLPIFLSIQFALFLALDQSRTMSFETESLGEFFAALSGAESEAGNVVKVTVGKEYDDLILSALPIAGVIVAVCFVFLEYLLDGYITNYREGAKALSGHDSKLAGLLQEPTKHFDKMRLIMWVLYSGPIVFWGLLLLPS